MPHSGQARRRRAAAMWAVAACVGVSVVVPAATLPAATLPNATATPTGASDEMAESTEAVVRAQAALDRARAGLTSAQAALTAARQELARSKALAEQARLQLEAARLAEVKTEGEIAELRERLVDGQNAMGELARQAYRGGQFATLNVVLEAEDPGDFADRLVSLRTVLRSENVTLAEVSADQAELSEHERRLQAVRELQQRLADEAQRRLQESANAERAAVQAEQDMRAMVARQETALAAAERARAEDLARYRSFVTVSGAFGSSMLEWSQRLRAQKRSVNGTGMFVRPGTGPVTSEFGPRTHPILGYTKVHTGIDIGIGDGTVYAADQGVVVMAGYNNGYGNVVVVDHGLIGGKPTATLYGHQAALRVTVGQRVTKGQPLGLVGSTGMSTGPHIHFEVRISGAATDPWPWLAGAPNPRSVRP